MGTNECDTREQGSLSQGTDTSGKSRSQFWSVERDGVRRDVVYSLGQKIEREKKEKVTELNIECT